LQGRPVGASHHGGGRGTSRVTTIIDNTIIGANFELDYNIMHGFKKDPEIECSRKN
jgi:hypothetical protein